MKYKVLPENFFALEDYSILPYREEDIFKVKNWRNDQMKILRQDKILSDDDQEKYYNLVVKNSFSQDAPKIILFTFLQLGKCIGYGGLTNIDWAAKRAELSFLVDTERTLILDQYEKDFTIFITLMKMVLFDALNFNRLFAETFDIRDFHISILEKNGFVLEGRMKEHVVINNKFVDSLIHGYIRKYYESKG